MSAGRPYSEWEESDGAVLWFRDPIVEPPYCGDPREESFTFRFYCPHHELRWVPLPPPFRQSPPAPAPSDAKPSSAEIRLWVSQFEAFIEQVVGQEVGVVAGIIRDFAVSLMNRPAAPSPAFAELLRAAEARVKWDCHDLCHTRDHDGCECGHYALVAALAAAKAQGAQ